MHPIHLVLLGADSQEIMLDLIENKSERNFRISSYLNIGNEYVTGKGGQVSYRIPYYKRHDSYIELDNILKEKIKIIASCAGRTTFGKMLSHYSSLFDQSYTFSLTGVDMCPIFCSTLFNNTMILKASENTQVSLKVFCKHYLALRSLNNEEVDKNYPKSNYHNYIESAEKMTIDFTNITQKNMKTCKPVVYDTFQNLGIGMNFDTLNKVLAYNSELDLKFCVDDTSRASVMTDWLLKIVPGSDLKNKLHTLTKLSRKDFEKTRSTYCFIPSGISVDTIERFWTYVNFYCSRRYYISTDKPQYFTLDTFKLWGLEYDYLKHYYLLVKLILNAEALSPKLRVKILENCNCKKCDLNDTMRNSMSEFMKIKDLEDFESHNTTLPFATYEVAQYRSTNVWYGSTEFTIYTMFGSIKLYIIDGERKIRVDLEGEEMLDQIWHLFKIFTHTRGVIVPMPAYGINDTAELKIGFNDLNTPIVVEPGYRGVILYNTNVYMSPNPTRKIDKREGKYYYFENPVDFEIYQNYDINETFFEDHNLNQLQEFIFEDELQMDKNYLIRNVSCSKLFKIISIDESHLSTRTFEEKYHNEGLLGSGCSLTRAFALADQEGLTNYRSSVNPDKLNKPLLETQTYKDIPVLDLITKCSFARVTPKERDSLWKIALEEKIEKIDEFNLDRLIRKLGLTSTAGAINLVKTVFRDLSFEDIKSIPEDIISDFLFVMLKSAFSSLKDIPFTRNNKQILDNKKMIFSRIYLMLINKDAQNLSDYLARLFLRAQMDNSGSFWASRRENIYCSLYRPESNKLTGQSLFLFACLNRVLKSHLNKLLSIRQLLLIKKAMKDTLELIEDYDENILEDMDCDYFSMRIRNEDMELTNYWLDEDMEDELDTVAGSEDPENYNEREWESDKTETHYILNVNSLHKLNEYTVKNDFKELSVKTVYNFYQPKWLGHGNFYQEEDENGFIWYVSNFPGRSNIPLPLKELPYVKPKLIQMTEITTKPDNVAEEEKEERFEYAPTNTKSIQGILNDNMTDDEIYDYQCQVLINNGILDPEKYSKYFFKKRDVSSLDHFWNNLFRKLDLDLILKAKDYTTTRTERTSALPGFSGVLSDPIASCELKTLFGKHGEQLLLGNHSIGKHGYKHILRTIKRLYYKVDDNGKSLLTILLATLKDAIITNNPDSWYLEEIMGILEPMEDEIADKLDERSFVPPRPIEGTLNYTVENVYSKRKKRQSK
jgi:hypothetical protein